MKALPKRKGNSSRRSRQPLAGDSLNESPSEKEGKWRSPSRSSSSSQASMKALPKRKGNFFFKDKEIAVVGLNESPSEKEGKFVRGASSGIPCCCLNESPSEKEGKSPSSRNPRAFPYYASMKALPKRKGNWSSSTALMVLPSASMKALPKRKGNEAAKRGAA